MKNIIQKTSTIPSHIRDHGIVIFFLTILLAGLLTFRDYGISFDEHISRNNGVISFNYVFKKDSKLLTYQDRFYGVGFELPLYVGEKILQLHRPQEIFEYRHLATFLLYWIGLIYFYKLCEGHFHNRLIAICGTLFLTLSPRIWADAFYNSKDLAFMSVFIICAYTLQRFIASPSNRTIICLSVLSAWLISIRATGILILPITVIGMISTTNKFKHTITYMILTSLFTYLFWPILWSNPISHFQQALGYLSKFSQYSGDVLYLGDYINAGNIPWHYSLVWIGVTTPLLYLSLFAVGILATIKTQKITPMTLILFCWLLLPIISVILLNSTLYDGWRHVYFVYPPLIILSVQGFKYLLSKIRAIPIITIVSLGLVSPLLFMIKNHPYHNLYFNELAGGVEKAKQNFDLDYWGLTFREGLEFILTIENDHTIPVYFAYGSLNNPSILPEENRIRFDPQATPEKAKYILSNYRFHKQDYIQKDIYSVKVDGIKVMSVFKMYD